MYKVPSEAETKLRERLLFIFKGGKTKRFHTADTLTEQTVAEHSFGVAWLIMLLHPTARKELLLAGLAHDLAEHQVGDVSSPAKRQYPELKSAVDVAEHNLLVNMNLDFECGLTDAEIRILKFADMLDGMMFCIRERKMGSTRVVNIYNNFYAYTTEIHYPTENAYLLVETINNLWEKAHEGR